MSGFKIEYVGGIGRVTGSCTIIEHGTDIFLIDCGMIQGEAHSEFENEKDFPIEPSKIKFIILTHAHLDHCGLIPKLAENGFKGKIYCTRATKKLAIEILKDSARISKIYSEQTIKDLKFECMDDRKNFKWGGLQPIDKDLYLGLFRSAHILGSASVVISDLQSKDNIWFSGDVGQNCRENCSLPLLKHRQGPDSRNNLVVCESTNGAKESSADSVGFEDRENYFANVLTNTILKKRGDVIIPAFSLQRTQDILTDLYLLFKSQPDLCGGITVVSDSALANNISRIYHEELFINNEKNGEINYQYLNSELISRLENNDTKELRNLLGSEKTRIGNHTFILDSSYKPDFDEPTVYISSAGMCDAGRVVNHLQRTLGNKKNTVILTGYQAQGTRGSKLISIRDGETIDDNPLFPDCEIDNLTPSTVHATIETISFYSGHASREGLLDYLFNQGKKFCPPEIHLNHGDNTARSSLKEAILNKYQELSEIDPNTYAKPIVIAPEPNATYKLHRKEINQAKVSISESQQNTIIKEKDDTIRKLKEEIAQLMR